MQHDLTPFGTQLLFQLHLLSLHSRYWIKYHFRNIIFHICYFLSLEYSYVKYSVKLFLMPEAEPITPFSFLKEPWTPYYYSMYHSELQLILQMSFSHTIMGIPWRQRPGLFLLIADSSVPRAEPGTQWELDKYFLNEGNEKISENMSKSKRRNGFSFNASYSGMIFTNLSMCLITVEWLLSHGGEPETMKGSGAIYSNKSHGSWLSWG